MYKQAVVEQREAEAKAEEARRDAEWATRFQAAVGAWINDADFAVAGLATWLKNYPEELRPGNLAAHTQDFSRAHVDVANRQGSTYGVRRCPCRSNR